MNAGGREGDSVADLCKALSPTKQWICPGVGMCILAATSTLAGWIWARSHADLGMDLGSLEQGTTVSPGSRFGWGKKVKGSR